MVHISPACSDGGHTPSPFPEEDVDVDDGDADDECGGGDGCDDDHDDADASLCAFPQLLCRLAALVMRTLCLDIHSCDLLRERKHGRAHARRAGGNHDDDDRDGCGLGSASLLTVILHDANVSGPAFLSWPTTACTHGLGSRQEHAYD